MNTADPQREPSPGSTVSPEAPASPAEPPRQGGAGEAEELRASLGRIERMLGQIHGLLDTSQRARTYRDFSILSAAGALLQVLVVLLTIAAFIDWVYRESVFGLTLVKLGLATVLQLGALTAFIVAGQRNTER